MNIRHLFAQIGLLVLTLLAATAFAATDQLVAPLRVREVPAAFSDWTALRNLVLKDLAPENYVIEERENSLAIRTERDFYQVMLHQGDVIQYSTVTAREGGLEDGTQFGRSASRSFKGYLDSAPVLKEMYDFVRFMGVMVHENELVSGVRSALYFPADGSPPSIHLSDRYAKHPVFGLAHEAQHFLNRPLLPMLIDRILQRKDAPLGIQQAFSSFLDEYLAVAREVAVFRELSGRHPHLANKELLEVSRLTEADVKEYVFAKWRSYYKWPDELLRFTRPARLNANELLAEIHDFQMKFGRLTDVSPRHRRLLFFEQKENPKSVDPAVIASPKNNHLPWVYRPEAGLSFPIRTVWIPEEDLSLALDLESLPSAVRSELARERDGRKFHAFFVHPLSETEYRHLISRYESTFEFVATPGSSNRTLTVRSMSSGRQFYVKTSLALEIAGTKRTVPSGEVSRSVGHSMFLRSLAGRDPRVLFLPEPFGLIPKGFERGGQIVRLLEPNRPVQGLIPLFSFYSLERGRDFSGGIAASLGVSRSEFLKDRLAAPLHDLLLELRERHGVSHEAHAQNVLVEVGSNGVPTGRFVLKDLSGLNVDFARHREIFARVPVFKDRDLEYFQNEKEFAARQSIDSYFRSGFLYGVDQYLRKTDPAYAEGSIYRVLDRRNSTRPMPAGPAAGTPGSCEGLFF